MLLNNVHARLKFVYQTVKRTKIEIFSAEKFTVQCTTSAVIDTRRLSSVLEKGRQIRQRGQKTISDKRGHNF